MPANRRRTRGREQDVHTSKGIGELLLDAAPNRLSLAVELSDHLGRHSVPANHNAPLHLRPGMRQVSDRERLERIVQPAQVRAPKLAAPVVGVSSGQVAALCLARIKLLAKGHACVTRQVATIVRDVGIR